MYTTPSQPAPMESRVFWLGSQMNQRASDCTHVHIEDLIKTTATFLREIRGSGQNDA